METVFVRTEEQIAKFRALKQTCKELAKDIKEVKRLRKTTLNPNPTELDLKRIYYLGNTRYKFRITHIAYCLIRGRKYEEIEQPQGEMILNERDWKFINEVKQAYE